MKELDKNIEKISHILWNCDTEYDAKVIGSSQIKQLIKDTCEKNIGNMQPINKYTINKDGSTNCIGQYDARARNRLRREILANLKKELGDE